MIRSSVFSFDESSIWDPKVIRQHLIISEDQLNILNSISEWSVGRNNSCYSRIETDTTCESENSLSATHPNKTLHKNQELNYHNLELFDKHFETRRNILKAYKLRAQKFSKSISLFEIDKIDKNLPSTSCITSALSLPNLCFFSKNSSAEFKAKHSLPERYPLIPDKNINLLIPEAGKKTDLTTLTNTNISKLNRSEDKTYIKKCNMEVVSQLPVANPNVVEGVHGVFEIITLEDNGSDTGNSSDHPAAFAKANKSDYCNSDVSEKGNIVKSENFSSSKKNKIVSCAVKEVIPKNNCHPELCEKPIKLVESENLNSNEKNETDPNVKETVISNNCIHDTSEKVTKVFEFEGLNAYERDELKSIIVKETVIKDVNNSIVDKNIEISDKQILPKIYETSDKGSEELGVSQELCVSKIKMASSNESRSNNSNDSKMEIEIDQKTADQEVGDNKPIIIEETLVKDVNSSIGYKSVKINVDAQILAKVNETPDKVSEHLDVSQELSASKINVVSLNEQKNDSSHYSKIDNEIAQMTAHQEVGDNPSITAKTLSVKRKSDSKTRSSKRHKSTREKQAYLEERSLKKAGKICYSAEYIKTMLDTLKQFF